MPWDYVIVGAGSAGCVLAGRLSEDPGVRVLLLEAGPPDRRREIRIPAALTKLFRSEVDWAFDTEEEPHLHGRRLYWPRGRVVGGSSSINAMLYVRGHRRDYDRWRELGNPGWGWEDVLPVFRRAEDQERGASELHGVGGPLHVADQRDPFPVSRALVAAGEELGWPANPDFNGPRQEGFGLYQVTQKGGRRMSAARAYLEPARRRRNLAVQSGALVTRVLFAGDRAIGVEALTGNGVPQRLEAEREVLVAAGAVGSPHLLLRSGIGPADALRQHGIPVVVDLPGVGENLQDHPCVSVVYRAATRETLDRAETLGNLLRWALRGRGPLTSPLAEAGAFLRSSPGLDRPDLQLHFLPAALIDHGFRKVADQGFNVTPTLIRPESRGSIALRSVDPHQAPLIRANYLAEPRDLDVLVAGVEIARRLVAARAFDPFRDVEVVPGPGVAGREEVERFVRSTLQTLYHPVGTCRMGPVAETERGLKAVVGPRLTVHGTAGLRVVDASVMPEVVGGNTNAATMMIAERGAAWIAAGER